MRKRIQFIIILFILVFCFAGCGSTLEFSDKYLLSTAYGGASWGEFYECLDGYIIICTDGTVEVYMPELDEYGDIQEEYVYVTTITLTDEQYNAIASAINLKKLYKLDPRSDNGACDGYSRYLTIYDKNDQVLKCCGGYMPQNRQFNKMYQAVFDNLPMDELNAIRDEWITELKEEANQIKQIYD